MKEEYDFSNGERGKFYNKNATFNLPVRDREFYCKIGKRAEEKHE